jgi:superfamily I DNA/RNA helicase
MEKLFDGLGQSNRDIIVDEAQDIPAPLLRILAKRARSLMAFADPVQRFALDGSSIEELVDAIDSTSLWPVYVLEEDFRTTRAIQAFATAAWIPERVHSSRPARREGPLPIVRSGDAKVAVEEVRRWLASDGCASVVVATSQPERANLVNELTIAGIDVARRPQEENAKVRVLAFEALRGLEFDAVVLVPPVITRDSVGVHRANLYVSATRARHGLSVVLAANAPSALVEEINRAEAALVGLADWQL